MIEPGRELDLLIAKKVMGCYVRRNFKGCFDLVIPGGVNCIDFIEEEGAWFSVPHYSTNIAAAWEVVEKLGNDFFELSRGGSGLSDGWSALTAEGDAWAETAPHAICLAALKA